MQLVVFFKIVTAKNVNNIKYHSRKGAVIQKTMNVNVLEL